MDQPPPKESRAPINLRIKFRSESIDQFIDRYAIDVSRGGIFIRTREPLAVGTQLKFDFQLQDSSPLMAGEGTVVWIREYDANRTGITPGMGVRFDKLTSASQPVLEKILAEKGRRDQGNASGGIMSKVGAGMAVRRPSSTFTALDPRAMGLVATPGNPGGETPAGGTMSSDAAARRERRPSSPVLPASTPTGASPASASERTNQGGFGMAGGSGALPQRPRTPGPLPALETPGSGRHTTGTDVSSLVSRLTGARQANFEAPTPADIDKALDGLTGSDDRRSANEPTPVRRSPLSAADDGVPGLRDDDPASEPTKTGDALTDIYSGATKLDAADRSAAIAAANAAAEADAAAKAAAAAGTVDGAAPMAEIDSDRTLATSAEQVAQIVEESERAAAALENTAKEMPAVNPPPTSPPPTMPSEIPAPGPSLVLIKNDSPIKSDKAGKADKAEPGEKADKPSKVESIVDRIDAAVRRDELIANQQTPAPIVIASSAQSPTAAGSFTAGKTGATAAATGGVSAPLFPGGNKTPAGAPDSASPTAAKAGSARPPAKRRSAAPFVIAVLVAAGAIVAVLASQPSGPEHASESFQPRKPEETVAAKSPDQPTAAPAPAPAPAGEPAAPGAPAPAVAAGEANGANAAAKTPESTKPAEAATANPAPPPPATPPAAVIAAAEPPPPAPAPAEPTPAKANGAGRADKPSGSTAKAPASERKTVVVVGPKKSATVASAAASDSAAEGKKVEASEGAAGQRPAVQHVLKITSSPAGAEVLIDGQTVGTTPYQVKDIDSESPHAVTIRLDGYEPHEHMISASDWLKQKANLETAKVNVKLRKQASASSGESGAATAAAAKSEGAGAEPARAESPTKTESAAHGESKTEATGAAPTEKAVEKAEKATEPPPASATEPPKVKDEPAAPK